MPILRAIIEENIFMQLRELKNYQSNGIIKSVTLVPYGEDKSVEAWIVSCELNNGEIKKIAKARTQQTKIYKTIYGALSDIKATGIKEAKVVLDADK